METPLWRAVGRDGEPSCSGVALDGAAVAGWRRPFMGGGVDVLGWGGGETYCVWEGGARSKPERGLLKKGVDFEH